MYKLYCIGEVMSFHMIDDHAMPASRNVRVKNRLSFRERSWGITKKQQPPPKRMVRFY